jgi:hypothetical protein
MLADRMFCLTGSSGRGELVGVSPALRQPSGVIGAVAEPGCGPYFDGPPDSMVAVKRIPWGAIQARYGP